jgi:alpha-D-ribose 1-methylphosphonate 5-triphosphate synthase subunit PhnH
MVSVNIEKLNRDNFRALTTSLSMPGKISKIEPFLNSSFLAVASVLLYNEVSYFYEGSEDFGLIEVMTNTKKQSIKEADYIFSDKLDAKLLKEAKRGDFLNPDYSAVLIFKCDNFYNSKVRITGPGINISKNLFLPSDRDFINLLSEKNSNLPLGVEIFFINRNNEVLGLWMFFIMSLKSSLWVFLPLLIMIFMKRIIVWVWIRH